MSINAVQLVFKQSPFIRMTSSVIDLETSLLHDPNPVITYLLQSDSYVVGQLVIRASPHSATPTEHPGKEVGVRGKAPPSREPTREHQPNLMIIDATCKRR